MSDRRVDEVVAHLTNTLDERDEARAVARFYMSMAAGLLTDARRIAGLAFPTTLAAWTEKRVQHDWLREEEG